MAIDFNKWKASEEEAVSFYRKPFDPAPWRDKFVKRIARTLRQLNGEVGAQGGRDYETLENNGVAYKPKLNNQEVEFTDFGDRDGFLTTRANLIKMLPELAKAVEAGELDQQIEEAVTRVAPAAFTSPAPAPAGRRTRRKVPEWSSDPKALHEQFVEFAGPPPGEGYVPNSKRTKWVSAAAAARGTKAQANKGKAKAK